MGGPSDGRVLAGTRDAVYLPTGDRLPWEQVEAADWDSDAELFRLSEVGSWGEQRREHAFALGEPGRFLELVRERVTASLVLQRHVPVRGDAGLRVIGRRAPRGGTIAWFVHYDEGVDPADPEVPRSRGGARRGAWRGRARLTGLDFGPVPHPC